METSLFKTLPEALYKLRAIKDGRHSPSLPKLT